MIVLSPVGRKDFSIVLVEDTNTTNERMRTPQEVRIHLVAEL
jgi:hypothetical protein